MTNLERYLKDNDNCIYEKVLIYYGEHTADYIRKFIDYFNTYTFYNLNDAFQTYASRTCEEVDSIEWLSKSKRSKEYVNDLLRWMISTRCTLISTLSVITDAIEDEIYDALSFVANRITFHLVANYLFTTLNYSEIATEVLVAMGIDFKKCYEDDKHKDDDDDYIDFDEWFENALIEYGYDEDSCGTRCA